MKAYLPLALGSALLLLPAAVLAANPVVSNLTASQRAGTKQVDIAYDLTVGTPTVQVPLEVSIDGGATFTVPVTAATGAVGNEVAVDIKVVPAENEKGRIEKMVPRQPCPRVQAGGESGQIAGRIPADVSPPELRPFTSAD